MKEIGAPLSICDPPIMAQPDKTQENEAKAIEELHKWELILLTVLGLLPKKTWYIDIFMLSSRWNMAEPIAPEIHMLDRVLCELVRQVGAHCWERGSLLQRVRVRYWSILEVQLLFPRNLLTIWEALQYLHYLIVWSYRSYLWQLYSCFLL